MDNGYIFARDLGDDTAMTVSAYVSALCRAGFYQLKQLRSITHSLTHEAAKTLVQLLISSRLDYCDSSLFGVSDKPIRKIHCVPNASSHEVRSEIISLQCHNFIGFQSTDDWSLRSTAWFAKSLFVEAPTYLLDDNDLV